MKGYNVTLLSVFGSDLTPPSSGAEISFLFYSQSLNFTHRRRLLLWTAIGYCGLRYPSSLWDHVIKLDSQGIPALCCELQQPDSLVLSGICSFQKQVV